MDPFVGQTLDGRYLVEQRIGEGGMGAVYRGRHIAMAQPIAIKVLLTDRANDPSMVQRFTREARSSFQIDHPHCVRVTDFGALSDGTLYMVMEYLDGRTIDTELTVDGPMSSKRVQHIGAQTAEALHYAHGRGLIHRDLKPANIMLQHRAGDFDYVKVFDFGLAKLFDGGAMLTGLSMSPLTQSGIVFGTPEYMSPEQALGGELTPRSDVYTLGLCCYEMLTGRLPFEGATFTEILSKHVKAEPPWPSSLRPDLAIEPGLEALIMRCLRKDASERQDALDLAAALRDASSLVPAARPSGVTNSETLDLSQAAAQAKAAQQIRTQLGHAPAPKPQVSPRPTAASASELPAVASGTRYRPLFLVGGALALALALVVVLAIAFLGADEETSASAAPSGSELANAEASALRSPVQALPDAAPAPILDASASPLPDASPELDAGTRPHQASKPASRVSLRKVPKNEHLQAAEAAHKAQNNLKQLSEANAALREMPRSRRAAYLVADALLRAGDKVRACKFFKRSSRAHFRAAGCSD